MAARKTSRKKSTKARSSAPDWKSKRLKGKSFCFSGTLQHGDRKQATAMIEAEGGQVAANVTAALDFLVVGKTRGSGLSSAEKKVQSLNQKQGTSIAILDESGFHQLFVPDRETAIAMLKAGQPGVKRWQLALGKRWFQGRVDLSGADLKGVELSDVSLRNSVINGGNLRGAKLNKVEFGDLTDCCFDGATLDHVKIRSAVACSFLKCSVSGTEFDKAQGCDFSRSQGDYLRVRLVQCTLQHMDVPHMWVYDSSQSDFSKSKLADLHCGLPRGGRSYPSNVFDGCNMRQAKMNYYEFPDSSFQRARLEEADLSRGTFQRCRFDGANLVSANLAEADLSEANLAGAKLKSAKLQNATLARADLTGADLRDTDLFNADLTDAIVDGADFRGAKLSSAKLDGVDTSTAKNLTVVDDTFTGSIGPNIRKLEQVVQKSQHIETSLDVLLEGQRYRITTYSSRRSSIARLIHEDTEWGRAHWVHRRQTTADVMLLAGNTLSTAEFLLETLKVKTSKCPLSRKDIQDLALAAWCEALGMDLPSPEELKQSGGKRQERLKGQQETALAELQGGAEGIARWNARSRAERKRLGKFRKADLQGVDLRGAELRGLDLRGADLRGAKFGAEKHEAREVDCRTANMEGAQFQQSIGSFKFHDANLRNTKFSKATLWDCKFARADLSGARCQRAEFKYCDFRAANLKTAKLSGATFESSSFDEKTVFPKGFTIPDGLVWRGQGKDPRLVEKIAQVQSAGPIDFETFMEQLANNFDQSRLTKAMKMLKAERFQLFAQVENDSVTGVVKSQTDADLVYSCRLDSEGTFACCTQNLNPCGGLRGALCKHLLVLIVGLTKGEELDPTTVNGWVAASKLQAPKLDKDLMSEVFLKYKGAEAGEIDWRPTETVPEDYYAF